MRLNRFFYGLLAGLMAAAPTARGMDVRLQELPPAPGLRPSAALDPLEGMGAALSCGLDVLGNPTRCGLSSSSEAAAPFLVGFDPMFCRPTMRFPVGQLIDGLLGRWIAGASALCPPGAGPRFCAAFSRAAPATAERQRAPREALKTAKTPGACEEIAPQPQPQPQPEATRRETGLDHLVR